MPTDKTRKTTQHLSKLSLWLSNTLNESSDKQYRHRRLQENLEYRSEIIPELKLLIQEAHEDTRNELQKLLGILSDPLDPFGEPNSSFLVNEYPKCLHIDTLKGYFGEIFAGIIAENFSPFGVDYWEIPAFPFRFHNAAFEQLERLSQTGEKARQIPGRTGDDCLAFHRDKNGTILSSLICEAKCTTTHQLTMIAEAHEKASTPQPKPVIITQLIKILQDDNKPNSSQWIDSLTNLLFQKKTSQNYERYDLVSYICGLPPVNETTEIIPITQPHEKYTGGRKLEAVEIHLHDIEGLIEAVYEKREHIDFIKNNCSVNTEELWQRILNYLTSQNSQNLFRENCSLLAYDEETAVISVRSLSRFRDIQRKVTNIKDAFSDSGVFQPKGEVNSNQRTERVNVKLTVMKKEED